MIAESRILWALLLGSGAFTVALGTVHFFMPVLFDFKTAIPRDGSPIAPFRLFFFSYPTARSDVHGIAWVMNHAVSFTLVTLGVVDLFAGRWLGTPGGVFVGIWAAAFWALRAGSQLYLGRRRGDFLVMGWFAALAALHLCAAWT